MIKKDLEKEILKIVEERQRRKNFFDYIFRKNFIIPVSIVLLILIDDPDITITKVFFKIIKSMAGI